MKKIKRRNISSNSVRKFFLNKQFNYIFGMPGCGKSTTLAAISECCYESGIPCFSSHPLEHAYKFVGFDKQYPAGSVFLFDEIYEFIGNNLYGKLPQENIMFFKEFRHSRYTIWAASQEEDDAARRIRGVVTRAYELKLSGKYTKFNECVLKENNDSDGKKYEYVTKSAFLSFLLEPKLYRKDFYDNFDSYSRRYFEKSAKFEAW